MSSSSSSSQKSTKRPSLNPTGRDSLSRPPKMTTTTTTTATTRSASPPPTKRRRTASVEADLLTPPQQDDDPLITNPQPESLASDKSDLVDNDDDIFSHAAHVLATEAAALASISALYRTNALAKQNLKAAVKTIVQSQHSRGKLIVTGVGKSAYIGQKLVATCKSMGVAASFMHACEAAHGDLGDVREVSFSYYYLQSCVVVSCTHDPHVSFFFLSFFLVLFLSLQSNPRVSHGGILAFIEKPFLFY